MACRYWPLVWKCRAASSWALGREVGSATGVRVGVAVGVGVEVRVGAGVEVAAGFEVDEGASVGVSVGAGVAEGVKVAVGAGEGLAVGAGVWVGIRATGDGRRVGAGGASTQPTRSKPTIRPHPHRIHRLFRNEKRMGSLSLQVALLSTCLMVLFGGTAGRLGPPCTG
jgi:hypothetical protein